MPVTAVEPFSIEAQSPDEFVLDVVNLAPAHVAAVAQRQADALQRPPCTVGALLDDLCRHGLPRAAAELRRYL